MTLYRAVVTFDFEVTDHTELRSRESSMLELLVQHARADFLSVDFRVAERRPRKRARCPAPDEIWAG